MKLRKEHKLTIFRALLGRVLSYYFAITTALIVVSWGRVWFSGADWALYGQDLGRILLIAFLGVFPSAMMSVVVETISVKGELFRHIISFVITAMLVFGIFMFLPPTGGGITLGTIITFLLIYAAFWGHSMKNAIKIDLQDKKLAEDINQKLNEIHKDENETHQG